MQHAFHQKARSQASCIRRYDHNMGLLNCLHGLECFLFIYWQSLGKGISQTGHRVIAYHTPVFRFPMWLHTGSALWTLCWLCAIIDFTISEFRWRLIILNNGCKARYVSQAEERIINESPTRMNVLIHPCIDHLRLHKPKDLSTCDKGSVKHGKFIPYLAFCIDYRKFFYSTFPVPDRLIRRMIYRMLRQLSF